MTRRQAANPTRQRFSTPRKQRLAPDLFPCEREKCKPVTILKQPRPGSKKNYATLLSAQAANQKTGLDRVLADSAFIDAQSFLSRLRAITRCKERFDAGRGGLSGRGQLGGERGLSLASFGSALCWRPGTTAATSQRQ